MTKQYTLTIDIESRPLSSRQCMELAEKIMQTIDDYADLPATLDLTNCTIKEN